MADNKWSREAITEKVRKVISSQLEVDEDKVTADASVIDDLGADSLDIVEIVMSLEEEFGIEIPDEDAEKLSRVKHVVDYLAARL
ncbi:MAG: acyl carrier protein [Firmicutes bacterium]|jgi:acyl carrier protein|nr:acyl carrier protein [Bacillota bacterium]